MNLATDYLKYVCQFVLDNCGRDVAFLEEHGDTVRPWTPTQPHRLSRVLDGARACLLAFQAADLARRLRDVVAKPFVHLTYTQAVEMLTQPEVVRWGRSVPPPFIVGDPRASPSCPRPGSRWSPSGARTWARSTSGT